MCATSSVMFPCRTSLALFLFFALLGAVVVLISTSAYGVGLSPDSVGYVSAARSLSAGAGFANYASSPITVWPPLFPAILSAVELIFGVDPFDSARVLNALTFGGIVALIAFILRTYLPSRHTHGFLALGLLWALFSKTLLGISVMAWTEPLFILFSLFFLLSLSRYLETGRFRFLVASCMLATLALLTRYIGVTLVVVAVTAIAASRSSTLKLRLVNAAMFGTFSVLPLAVWLARNWCVSGTLMGERAPSQYSLLTNLRYTRDTLFSWFLPDRLAPWYTELMPLGLLLLIVIIFVFRKNNIELGSSSRLSLLMAWYVLVYSFFIVVSSTTTAYDRIGNRLLSPIYPTVILLLLLIAANVYEQLESAYPRIVLAGFLIASMWSLVPVRQTVGLIRQWVEYGAGGYSTATWHQSEIIAYLSQKEDQCENLPIHSNRPDALYVLANVSAELTPRRTYYNSEKVAEDLETLRGN